MFFIFIKQGQIIWHTEYTLLHTKLQTNLFYTIFEAYFKHHHIYLTAFITLLQMTSQKQWQDE